MQRFPGIAVVLSTVLLVWASPAQAWPPDSFFDVFLESTAGPPYPSTPAVGTEIWNQTTSGGPLVETGLLSLDLHSTDPIMPAHMSASDSGGGVVRSASRVSSTYSPS